ncbi:protein in the TAR-I ttuE-ttuC' intergenic region [Aureimonas altamirensis]|uniref:Protein in the TAR-I ttuE-ttuC' intergenic region n=1 Tax=Aureimonas altamirensis TaxID=370622 RepID=A0A0B1Q373_9HYPH|nr:tripartite tricarboxylate transporter substrate-binding protein [Aureimonas altamirensis]KHJ54849.1 protein in the TAR-I ttuE-ttuC' intergenic region [Aureimonas altamirensis]
MKAILAGSALAALILAGPAWAFPDKPITIIVPAAAGGPSDTVARLVAQSMGDTLGQQVLVENLGGAGGSLGAGQAARAAPDGYTLLLYHVGVATFSALYPQLPYEPTSDFSSVGLITEVPMAIVGRKDLPAADIAGLIEALRGGEALSFGTAGVGAVSDLCGMLLSDALGAEMVVVPYKGTGPAMTDLMGGQIDLMCDQTTNTANQIESGEVKPYAVTTRTRIDRFPDLPTVAESGLDGFEITAWHALWAPAGTPDDIRHRLAEALRTALHDATVKERFAALGTVPVTDEAATPEALDTHFRSEVERWTRLIGSLETPAQ